MAISHSCWHCYWNFSYEGSYLPGVICNIVVKAHFGRSSFQMKCSTRSDISPLTCQMKWPRSDVSSNFQMRYPDQLSDIPPHNLSYEVTKIRCEFKFSDVVPKSAVKYTPITYQMKWSRSHISKNFQMQHPDRLSDIPPPVLTLSSQD